MQWDNYDIRCRDWKQAKHELIPSCTTTHCRRCFWQWPSSTKDVTTASSSVDLDLTSIFIADRWCHLFPSLLLLFDGISTLLSAHLLESCDHIWCGIVIIPASVTATAIFPPPRWIDIYRVAIIFPLPCALICLVICHSSLLLSLGINAAAITRKRLLRYWIDFLFVSFLLLLPVIFPRFCG